MFGGNSNWRGPVWIPVNTLLIRGLLEMYPFYGDDFKVESDHGDMLGDQNLWRKTYAYEQSSHISLLLRPARSQSLDVFGHVTTLPVEIRDLLPTFLDAAGATVRSSIEGKSLLHLLRTNGEGWRQWIDLEHNVAYSDTNHWNALTDGRSKYIFHALDGNEQFFDLTTDPSEPNDLAVEPRHSAQLALWRKRLVDHLAIGGPEWVQNGKLMPRPKGLNTGPNFPGYAPEEQIAGWI
jgi:arylsulfatase A-like enzyme